MSKDADERIFVCLDGSERSLYTVRYVSEIGSLKRRQILLFHVYSEIPENYWDLVRQRQHQSRLAEIRSWEMQEKRKVEKSIEEARQMLLDAGFEEKNVVVISKKLERGIARDILRESKKGCWAVVAARRSRSRLAGIALGSVSSKLLEKVNFAPLILVGKKSSPAKVLIAMDGSDNSLRCVDFVAKTLGDSKAQIRMLHVIRGKEEKHVELARQAIDEVFRKAGLRLTQSGFQPDQIDKQIITGVQSRAGAIIKEAKKSGCSTIVVGRRGLSKVEEFFIGRVSNKVVYAGKGMASWIVN